MKTKATFQKKLASYAALAGGIVAANNSNAQIVYTDVNPDITINTGDFYPLDLNNDGTVDFVIDAGINAASTWKKVEIYASSTNLNSAAAYLGGFSFYYANMFASGSPINNSNTFYGAIPYVTLAIVYTSGAKYGPWAGAVDGYLGVRINVGSNQYYGWVRMDVAEDAGSAVIKDYAYEATPNKSINAGAINVGIQSIINEVELKMYSSNKMLYVNSYGINFPSEIIVTNTVGQIVKQMKLENRSQQFDLSEFSSSVYIINIIDGEKNYSGKIVL